MDYQENYQQPNQGFQQPAMPKPSTNLVWAILCTIFCCLPFGIVSIVYASKVDSLWTIGAYREAYIASGKARNWAIWGVIACAICTILYILGYVFIFGALIAAGNM